MQNYTDQILINGHWTVSEAGGASSSIGFGELSPVFPGDTVTATQEYGGKALTWNASFCYKGKVWWSDPRTVDTKSPAIFTLMVDSQNNPFVKSPGGDRSPMQTRGDGCR
ncbi:hypothetical protein [Rhodococcus jostii]|uniref:hypothetical protein n=1 Tax=Rhodococcus jostii TaxID=132919 RepID=UPI00363BB65C